LAKLSQEVFGKATADWRQVARDNENPARAELDEADGRNSDYQLAVRQMGVFGSPISI
jgi:hypothetical protein